MAHAIVFSLTANGKGWVGSMTLVKVDVWQWVPAATCRDRNTESVLVVGWHTVDSSIIAIALSRHFPPTVFVAHVELVMM